MSRTFVLVALLLGIGHSSAAAETRTKMFPLTSSGLPKSLKGAPAELSRVLARAIGAELTPMPIDDAASLVGCSLTVTTCLEEIAKSAGVPKIVWGHVEENDDGDLVIKLSSYETGKGEGGRKFTVTGDTVDDVVESLRDTLDDKPRKPEPPKPPPIIDPVPVATTESGGVTKGTWGMIIGGALVAGAGAGVYASTSSLRKKINALDPQNADDFVRLQSLETAGKQRVQVGGALMVVGGVVATVGVIRAIVQKSSKRETPMLDVQAEKGGMSVVLTLGWR